jgi:hypothetical protein
MISKMILISLKYSYPPLLIANLQLVTLLHFGWLRILMAAETSLASDGLTKHAGDNSMFRADQYEFLVFLNSAAVELLAECITLPGRVAERASH